MALAANKEIKVQKEDEGGLLSFEYAKWRVDLSKGQHITILSIYRPPFSMNNPVTLATFLMNFQTGLQISYLKTQKSALSVTSIHISLMDKTLKQTSFVI